MVHVAEKIVGQLGENRSFFRENQTFSVSDQELNSEFGFLFCNGVGNRRLRDIQVFCGAAYVVFSANRLKISKLVQCHMNSPNNS